MMNKTNCNSFRVSIQTVLQNKMKQAQFYQTSYPPINPESMLMSTMKSIAYIQINEESTGTGEKIQHMRKVLFDENFKKLPIHTKYSSQNNNIFLPRPRKNTKIGLYENYLETLMKNKSIFSQKKVLPAISLVETHKNIPSFSKNDQYDISLNKNIDFQSLDQTPTNNKSISSNEKISVNSTINDHFLLYSGLKKNTKILMSKKKWRKQKIKIQECIEKQREIKMSKQILEHMNRYKKRDLFETKLCGFKTTIYNKKIKMKQCNTLDKSNDFFDLNNVGNSKKFTNLKDNEEFNSFIKRKKLKNSLLSKSLENARNNTNTTVLNQYLKINTFKEQERKRKSKQITANFQFTPWETHEMVVN